MCTNVYIYIYIYVNISVSILAQGQVVTPSAIPSTAILQRCRLSQVHNPRLRLLTEALEILRLLGDPKALCSDTVFFFGMMASSGSMASDEQIKKCCNEVRQRRIENAKREDEVIRTCGKHKKETQIGVRTWTLSDRCKKRCLPTKQTRTRLQT